MQTLSINSMKYAKKTLWHFVCFSALGAYLRGVFLSTPYINKEVNHHAGSLRRLLVVLMNLKQWLFYGCAASIKNSSGLKKGLKIGGGLMGGGFLVDVLRWAQVVKILPGAGMKISAGSFLKSQRVFFRGALCLSPDLIYWKVIVYETYV